MIIPPFPVLHRDTLDYVDNESYSAEVRRPSKTEVTISHRLKKDNMVGSLVSQGKAVFYCTVSASGTIYRCTKTIGTNSAVDEKKNPSTELSTNENVIYATHSIEIPNFRWKPDIFVITGIILLEDQKANFKKKYGLSEFWGKWKHIIPTHSRIAFEDWKRPSMRSLFLTYSDEGFEKGAFKTETSRVDPFRVSITMHPDLYEEVNSGRDRTICNHVLCSSLTQTFQDLSQAWQAKQESETEEHNQFLELADGLKVLLLSNGLRTWEDEDFNPTYTASMCYKVILDDDVAEED